MKQPTNILEELLFHEGVGSRIIEIEKHLAYLKDVMARAADAIAESHVPAFKDIARCIYEGAVAESELVSYVEDAVNFTTTELKTKGIHIYNSNKSFNVNAVNDMLDALNFSTNDWSAKEKRIVAKNLNKLKKGKL